MQFVDLIPEPEKDRILRGILETIACDWPEDTVVEIKANGHTLYKNDTGSQPHNDEEEES